MQQDTRALFDNNVTDNDSDQVMKITDCIVDIHSRRLNFYSILRITRFFYYRDEKVVAIICIEIETFDNFIQRSKGNEEWFV